MPDSDTTHEPPTRGGALGYVRIVGGPFGRCFGSGSAGTGGVAV
jgi:hypothetical protein